VADGDAGEGRMTAIKYKEAGTWKTLTIPSAVHIGPSAPDPTVKQLWVDTDDADMRQAPALVSTLPSSPYEGQEVYYQNAAMALQGVVWHLKFRDTMGLTFYQWEFLGGAPLANEVVGTFSLATAAFTDGTGGPSFTLPLAGDYDVTISSAIWSGATNSYGVVVPALVGGPAPTDNDGALYQNCGVANTTGYVERTTRRNASAAGMVLKHQYRSSAGGTSANFGTRGLSARPVRVA